MKISLDLGRGNGLIGNKNLPNSHEKLSFKSNLNYTHKNTLELNVQVFCRLQTVSVLNMTTPDLSPSFKVTFPNIQ